MNATDRLLATLAERDQEIRCLRRDNEVLVSSLRTLADTHGDDEVAEDIIGGLELSGRRAQVSRSGSLATR